MGGSLLLSEIDAGFWSRDGLLTRIPLIIVIALAGWVMQRPQSHVRDRQLSSRLREPVE